MGLKIKYTRCYKPYCRCMKGGPRHGPFIFQRQTVDGKKRDVYLLAPGRVKPKAICPVCDKEFRQNNPWHSYCSKSCKQAAYYRRRLLNPEFYGSGNKPQKVSNDMKKQKQVKQEQPKAAPTKPAKAKAPKVPAAPTPPAQPALTLAQRLLELVEQWHKDRGLSEQQFEDALAEVWQAWPQK